MTDCSLSVVNATDYTLTLIDKKVEGALVFDVVSWNKEPSQSIPPRGSDTAGAAGVKLAKPRITLTDRIECGAADGEVSLFHDSGTIFDPIHIDTSGWFSEDIAKRFWITSANDLDVTITIHQGIEP